MSSAFLALGDSYTVGEGVPRDSGWPARLAAAATARGVPLDPPVIIARTGWTTDELAAAIDADPPTRVFDLVTLGIGVNDQYRGRGADEYEAGFAGLLRRAIGFAGGRPHRVMVVSIPDWGVTPFATAEGADPAKVAAAIDQLNRRNRRVAERCGVHYVDVTAVSRELGAAPRMLAADGLHPSAAMYARWTDLVLPTALDALAASA